MSQVFKDIFDLPRCQRCGLRRRNDASGRCTYCVATILGLPRDHWEAELALLDIGQPYAEPRVAPVKQRVTAWLHKAWEHLRDSYYYIVLGGSALAYAGMAVLEFVLHVLRIPHWPH